MKIKSAEFVLSAASPRQFPPSLIPEVAFVGKSNVGKSSLINSLLNRKRLVKTSSVPGKTQMINFFLINGMFHLVDLPGYGFANTPKSVRGGWEALIQAYLLERRELRGVVMIVDARHAPAALDLRMREMLVGNGLTCLTVANKIDKLKRSQTQAHLRTVREALALREPPLAYSAQDHTGRPQVWSRVEDWLSGEIPPGVSS